jgi:hypothetical protein
VIFIAGKNHSAGDNIIIHPAFVVMVRDNGLGKTLHATPWVLDIQPPSAVRAFTFGVMATMSRYNDILAAGCTHCLLPILFRPAKYIIGLGPSVDFLAEPLWYFSRKVSKQLLQVLG